jgi:(p)ppGpp synthase/HD superfamily hydrolase
MPALTERFDEALRFAHDLHREQLRKGNGSAYFGHLLGVASIVLDDGGTEDEAIGALLHDAAEDQGGREQLDAIRERFGPAVAQIVEDCTDSWDTPKGPWLERKRQYVEHARQLGPSSLRVAVADKVHNAYASLRDLRNEGDKVWDRFNAPADDVIAYYESIVRAFRQSAARLDSGQALRHDSGHGGGKLVDELERIVKGIQREMGY